MNAEPIDKLSSELLDALDKLNWDINRKVLQLLLDKGEQKVPEIFAMFSSTYQGFAVKLSSLEKANLIQTTLAEDQRTIEKIKLTMFGEVLLQGLLVAQKLLEAKS